MKKTVSKDQLKSMTKNIISNAVKAGEDVIADVEMGIVQAQEEVQKSDYKENE
jgi:hypothetical protein